MKRLLAALVIAGCGDAGTAARDLPADAWRPLAPDMDPLANHRPEEAQCPDWARAPEGNILEVNTGGCRYAALSQPAGGDFPPSSTLELVLQHLSLVAPEPATAHVALAVGGHTVWESHIPIPHREQLLQARVELPDGTAVDTPVVFHLHNHGQNSWRLVRLRIESP